MPEGHKPHDPDVPAVDEKGATRQEFLKRAGAVGLGAAVGGSVFASSARARWWRMSSLPFSGQTVRVFSYGGAWHDFLMKWQVPRFQQMTGATVQLMDGTAPKFAAEFLANGKANPPLDVWACAELFSEELRLQGHFVPLPTSHVPNLRLVPKQLRQPGNVGVLGLVSPLGIVYRSDKIPRPTSWLDLAKYPNQVALLNIGNADAAGQVLKYAAVLGHGRYKPNWQQGMNWISGNLHSAKQAVFGTDMAPWLQSGEVLIGLWDGTDYANLKVTGVPLGFVKPKEGWAGSFEQDMNVPVGSKVKPLAFAFINDWLSTPVQRYWMLNYYQFPANIRAWRGLKLSAKEAELIPVHTLLDEREIPRWDYAWLASGVYQDIVAAWNKQMS